MAIDGLGKNTDITNADIAQGMMSAVKEISKYNEKNSSASNSTMESIASGVERVVEIMSDISLPKSIDSAKSWTTNVVNSHKEVQDKKGSQGSQSDQKKRDKTQFDAYNISKKLYTEAKKQNTLWFGVSKFGSRAQQQLLKIIHGKSTMDSKNAAAAAAAAAAATTTTATTTAVGGSGSGGSGSGGSGSGGSGSSGSGSSGSGTGGSGGKWANQLATLANAASIATEKLEDALNAFDINIGNVFAGVIKDENRFRMNMRQTVYEIAGFSAMNKELERGYEDVSNAVAITGMSRSEYQKIWLKNIQRGLAYEAKEDKLDTKNHLLRLKRHKAVTTTAIFTARQLNMDADSINDTFMNWNVALGMTTSELSQVGRSLQSIARSTGVTGANLESAVKTTQQFAKKMRSAGNLNAESLANITELTALHQKYDISEQGAKITGALTSYKDFLSADQQTMAMIARVSKGNVELQNAIRSGTVLRSKDLTRQFAKGYERDVKRLMASQGVTNEYAKNVLGMTEDISASNMDDVIKRMYDKGGDAAMLASRLDMISNSVYGQGIGDTVAGVKAHSEQGKSSAEKLADLQKEMGNIGAGAHGSDKYKELKKRSNEMKEGAYQEGFGKIINFMKLTGIKDVKDIKDVDRTELRQSLEKDLGKNFADDFMKDGDFGVKAASELMKLTQQKALDAKQDPDALKELFLKSSDWKDGDTNPYTRVLNEGAEKVTMESVQRDLASSDIKKRESAEIILTQVMQELATLQKADQDPITAMNLKLSLLNESIRDWTAKWLSIIPLWAIQLMAYIAGLGLAIKVGFGMWGVTKAIGRTIGALWGVTKTIGGTIGTLWGAAKAKGALWRGGSTPHTSTPHTSTPHTSTPHTSTPHTSTPPAKQGWWSKITSKFKKTPKPSVPPTSVPKTGMRLPLPKSRGGNIGLALAAIAGTAYVTNKMGLWGGKKDEGVGEASLSSNGLGDWGDGNPLPVYLVNWQDLCSCTGGTGGVGGVGGGVGAGGAGGIERFQHSPNRHLGLTEQFNETLEPEREATVVESSLGTIESVAMGTWLSSKALNGLGNKIPALASTSKVGGAISKAGGLAGKAFAPLQIAVGAATGWTEAEKLGINKTTGATFGALTGGATTGSLMSEYVGIQKGGNADELMGAYGSMAYGATAGSMILPGVGTAIGAAVAGSAEIYKVAHMANNEVDKMTASLKEQATSQTGFREKSLLDTQKIQDPNTRLAEYEQKLVSLQNTVKGQEASLAQSQKERSETTNWFGLAPDARALNSTIESDKAQLDISNKAIKDLADKINTERVAITRGLNIEDPNTRLAEYERKLVGLQNTAKGQEANLAQSQKERSETTNWFGLAPDARALNSTIESDKAKLDISNKAIKDLTDKIDTERSAIATGIDAMSDMAKQGTTKGSIFVHDTHCEAKLTTMLQVMNIGTSIQRNIEEYCEAILVTMLQTMNIGALLQKDVEVIKNRLIMPELIASELIASNCTDIQSQRTPPFSDYTDIQSQRTPPFSDYTDIQSQRTPLAKYLANMGSPPFSDYTDVQSQRTPLAKYLANMGSPPFSDYTDVQSQRTPSFSDYTDIQSPRTPLAKYNQKGQLQSTINAKQSLAASPDAINYLEPNVKQSLTNLDVIKVVPEKTKPMSALRQKFADARRKRAERTGPMNAFQWMKKESARRRAELTRKTQGLQNGQSRTFVQGQPINHLESYLEPDFGQSWTSPDAVNYLEPDFRQSWTSPDAINYLEPDFGQSWTSPDAVSYLEPDFRQSWTSPDAINYLEPNVRQSWTSPDAINYLEPNVRQSWLEPKFPNIGTPTFRDDTDIQSRILPNGTLDKYIPLEKSEDGIFDKIINMMPSLNVGNGVLESRILSNSALDKYIPEVSPIEGDLFDKQINIISGILAGIDSITKFSTNGLSLSSNSNQKPSVEASTSPIDYSDDTKQAQVSTSMYSRDDAEAYIERSKYESTASSSAMIPSMEVISEYLLNTQSEKLDRIIAELVGIRQNTSSSSKLSLSGLDDDEGDTSFTSGLKPIANGNLRGFWGLQAGAFSPSNNNSDGRR